MKKAYTLRPTQKTAETIDKLAELMGVTKNKLLCSFLEEAQPHMQEMINALQLLNDKNPEGYLKFSQTIKDVVIEGLNTQSDLIDLMVKKPGEKDQEKEGKNAPQS